MLRNWLLLIGLLTAAMLSSGGCRSCSSCHDYDPPVANGECNACGCHRAGSASSGYASEGYTGEEYVTGEYVGEPPIDESVAPTDSQ